MSIRAFVLPAAVLALGAATVALAAPAYSTWQLPCKEVQSIVVKSGAVVMNTMQANRLGPETFDRLVRGAQYCAPEETAETTTVQARDTPKCVISFHCVAVPLVDED